MTTIHAGQALLPSGWAKGVTVEVAGGRIATVTPRGAAGDVTVDVLLPAPANAHSHAFQRAMAGLTEHRGPTADSFWTWRQLMFRFLQALDPDQVEAIAAFVQMEMAEAGYGASVEFHYLHHAPGGRPYADLAEMSARICAAAATSGMGLTLLPVHYRWGGCDRRPLAPGQDRFGTDPEGFARLVELAATAAAALPPDTVVGVAPHSLRAVSVDTLPDLAALRPAAPVHMHLAEQPAEVAEVEAAHGRRPVELMLDLGLADPRWCLIHCTQMRPHETTGLAATGAVAGLCPLTEASLGDGTFDGARWLGAGGRIAVGSDSNIRIALPEELRQLETSQRLRDGSRAALAEDGGSTGRRLWEAAARGGAQAAGRDAGRIEAGALADLVALDGSTVDLEGLKGDRLLDALVFARGEGAVADVWSAGRHIVTGGRHVAREAIEARYRAAVRRLRERA